jgi:succinate-semialdehyde dehydrogenase
VANQAVVERSDTESAQSAQVDQAAIVDAFVNRAAAAQRQIESWSEERIDRLLRALGERVAERAEALAAATVEETGMGNVQDKTLKNTIASWASPHNSKGRSDTANQLRHRAPDQLRSPAPSVIVGLVPVTPGGDLHLRSLISIKARNAIILSPSRRARRVSTAGGRVDPAGVTREQGAPAGLVQWTAEETARETTTALMSQTGGVGVGHGRDSHG